jgi:hypothetical protein
VIVDEIDIQRVPASEPERDPPVAAHGDGPLAFSVAFQRMQAIAGQIEVAGCAAASRTARTF